MGEDYYSTNPKCAKNNLIALLVAVNKASVDAKKQKKKTVWLHEVEAYLLKEGCVFGPYFSDGGEENRLRRVRLCVGKGKRVLRLNLMRKYGITNDKAAKQVEAKLLFSINAVPPLAGDVDDILNCLA